MTYNDHERKEMKNLIARNIFEEKIENFDISNDEFAIFHEIFNNISLIFYLRSKHVLKITAKMEKEQKKFPTTDPKNKNFSVHNLLQDNNSILSYKFYLRITSTTRNPHDN